MSYVVLVRDSKPGVAPDPAWRPVTWRPTLRNWHPPGPFALRFLCWWAFHHLGIFSNRDYCVVVLVNPQGEVVHRLCMFPRYFRFPFMSERDLQIGDVRTLPSYEGRGCATTAVLAAVGASFVPGRNYWYVTNTGNLASIRVAEKAGFEVRGQAERTKRLGLSLFGSFILTGC